MRDCEQKVMLLYLSAKIYEAYPAHKVETYQVQEVIKDSGFIETRHFELINKHEYLRRGGFEDLLKAFFSIRETLNNCTTPTGTYLEKYFFLCFFFFVTREILQKSLRVNSIVFKPILKCFKTYTLKMFNVHDKYSLKTQMKFNVQKLRSAGFITPSLTCHPIQSTAYYHSITI